MNKLIIGLVIFLAGETVQAQYSYLMDSLLIYKYSDTNRVLSSSTIYTHHEKDSLLDAYVYSINSSGDRSLATHTRYHYDGVHPLWLNKTYRSWNVIDSSWKNLVYAERVFGSNGISTEANYSWNQMEQVWKISGKDSLFYDGNGRLESQVIYYLKSDTLSPSTLLYHVYGAGNHLDTLVWYASVSGQWKQTRRSEFHSGGAGLDTFVVEVNYHPTNGSITSSKRYRYMLNQTGDQFLQEYLVYDQLKSEWTVSSRWEQELEPGIPINQVQIQEEILDVFHFQSAPISGENSIIQNGELTKFVRYEYFMHQVNPNAIKLLLSQDLSVYPNPCTSMITVPRSDFPLAESVHIYTLQGVQVSRQMLDPEGQLAVNELIAGIYFLQVLDKEGRLLGAVKLVKQ